MKDNKESIYIKTEFKFICAYILFIFIVPIILNFLIPIPTPMGKFGSSETWLSFWGTWLAAAFGSSVTILGIYYTLKNNSDQFRRNLLYQEDINERERTMNLMPHLKISNAIADPNDPIKDDCIIEFNRNHLSKNSYIVKIVSIENIGLGSAKNIKITIDNHLGKFSQYNNEEFMLNLGVAKDQRISIKLYGFQKNKSYNIYIEYYDIINKNKYYQKGDFTIQEDTINNIILKEKTSEKV
ncbi:MAG: hypothetical protein ABRQ25_08950 [Clostridiaceae bacterium]